MDSSSSSKRRRGSDDYAKQQQQQQQVSCCRPPRRKQHLYLALDDWKGGYSIHKLDADDILDQQPPAAAGELLKLPEPPALRLASPVPGGLMAFAALGTNIVVATNPRCRHDHAPPTFVYDTETGALSSGPCLPDQLHDFGAAAMAVGERLYALTSVCFALGESPSLHTQSWAPSTRPELGAWDPTMEWSWTTTSRLPSPPFSGRDIFTHALHPDGHTLFVSTTCGDTLSFDTSNGVWRELGDRVLPFRGQAFFDAELDAWVGIHRNDDGHVCCCPVPSRSAAAATGPQCKTLMENLSRKEEGVPDGYRLRTSLHYMGGDSRFCFVESLLEPPREDVSASTVLHVTLFGLKFDRKGELRTKIRRVTRSYAVSRNSHRSSHAAFWI